MIANTEKENANKFLAFVNEINSYETFKKSPYRAKFNVNKEIKTLKHLNVEHFNNLAKIIYASDTVFDISLPNDIFIELNSTKLISKWKHRAFALSFYYLISFLWRSKTHFNIGDYSLLNQEKLKYYITGIKDSPTYNYLMIKKGVLPKLGFTKIVRDYPVEYEFYKKELVHVKMFSDLLEEGYDLEQFPPNAIIHKPLRGYYKYPKVNSSNKDNELDGHFFSLHETFTVQAETLLAILTNSKLGFSGFYFYCYLRKMNNQFPSGYIDSKENISKVLGMSITTIQHLTSLLKEMKIITAKQNYKDTSRIDRANIFIAKPHIKQITLI